MPVGLFTELEESTKNSVLNTHRCKSKQNIIFFIPDANSKSTKVHTWSPMKNTSSWCCQVVYFTPVLLSILDGDECLPKPCLPGETCIDIEFGFTCDKPIACKYEVYQTILFKSSYNSNPKSHFKQSLDIEFETSFLKSQSHVRWGLLHNSI